MSDTTKTEEKRDFSKPVVEVCEVARFDNDGHLTDVPLEAESGAEAPADAPVPSDVEETE